MVQMSEMDPSGEVLSVPVGDTGAHVEKHLVHACPDEYRYRDSRYITVRPIGGHMAAIWSIRARFAALPGEAANHPDLDESERERVRGYVEDRWGDGADEETDPYRFYVFDPSALRLPHHPALERNTQGACYFSVGELTSGRTVVRVASQVEAAEPESESYDGSDAHTDEPSAANLALRSDSVAWARFVEQLLPDLEDRRAALSAMADSIDAVVGAGALAWNVSVYRRNSLLLNVGRRAMLQVTGDGVWVVLDEASVPEAYEDLLNPATHGDSDYKRLAGARSVNLRFDELAGAMPDLTDAHHRVIERAAQSVRQPWGWDNHYGGVTAYMREFLGRDVADPTSYHESLQAVTRERRVEFEALFDEFLSEVIPTPAAQKRLAELASARETAWVNFAALVEQADRGEATSERILLTLFPYTATEENRTRGAWIFRTNASSHDFRKWMAAAGHTTDEEVASFATTLLRFVRRCVDSPDDLADAVAEYLASGYTKGVQTSSITPILNALRPDNFVVLNEHSRLAMCYFAGIRNRWPLQQYPQANSEKLRALAVLGSSMDRDGRPAGALDCDLFDMFAAWAVDRKKIDVDRFRGKKPRVATKVNESVCYWKVAPGASGWQWDECREKGFIAIGWDELGDVSGLTREEFDARLEASLERHPGDFTRAGANQLWPFANIKVGDRIVANRGLNQVLGIGTVVGPYAFVATRRHGHRLPVRWDDETPRQYDGGRGWQRTLLKLTAEQFEAIVNAPPSGGVAETPAIVEEEPFMLPESNSEYPISSLAADTGFDEGELAGWVRAIHRKGQAILYGPPGTGKTFVAEGLARHLVGGGFGFVDTVQFHPAYAYEDFMVGIRPRPSPGGGLEYPLVDGRFVEFCERARELDGTSVLVVDEINRANLARVFGELMLLLEYRDKTIQLAGGRTFSIPANVRLIGTMNTADRSIALVDHALRRRFAFLGLYPNYDVLSRRHRATGFPVSALIGVLARLNRAIGDPHYEVGIAFFMRDDLMDTLEDVWRMEIEPYIEEYFFDKRKAFEEFRWEKVRGEILGRAESA